MTCQTTLRFVALRLAAPPGLRKATEGAMPTVSSSFVTMARWIGANGLVALRPARLVRASRYTWRQIKR